jgi:hypothetical protein
MGELLVTELTMCAAVIVVAAAAMVVLRLRRSHQPRMLVEGRYGTVAELFDGRMPGREPPGLPGIGHDTMERDPGTTAPAGPEQAAGTPVSEVVGAGPGSPRLDTEPPEPLEPSVPQSVAGAVTFSEQVDGYYEEAERYMADYLAARGWTEEPGNPGQPAAADAAPASAEPAAEPAPRAAAEPAARRQLAA